MFNKVITVLADRLSNKLEKGFRKLRFLLTGLTGFIGIIVTIWSALIIPIKSISIVVTAAGIFLCTTAVIISLYVLIIMQLNDNLLKDFQAKQKERKTQLDLLSQKEINKEQATHIKSLENELRLFKNTQLQINGFSTILEVNLLEIPMKQTTVHRKILRSLIKRTYTKGWGRMKKEIVDGCNYDEALVILTHDVTAKFGIDLKDVHITNSKTAPDTIELSGIKPKFMGTIKNSCHNELVEVRTGYIEPEELENNAEEIHASDEELLSKDFKSRRFEIERKNAAAAILYADECRNEYNARLEKGLETPFMNDAVKKLGQNVLKSILAPLNKSIVFVDDVPADSISIADYFSTNIKMLESKIQKAIDYKREQIGSNAEMTKQLNT